MSSTHKSVPAPTELEKARGKLAKFDDIANYIGSLSGLAATGALAVGFHTGAIAPTAAVAGLAWTVMAVRGINFWGGERTQGDANKLLSATSAELAAVKAELAELKATRTGEVAELAKELTSPTHAPRSDTPTL